MSEAAKATGVGIEIEFQGKKYQMPDLTVEMIGLMERRLCRRMVERMEMIRDAVPESIFNEYRDATLALIGCGEFAYGSKAMANWSFSPEGMQYECYLKLNYADRSVTEELAADIWKELSTTIMATLRAGAIPDPTVAQPEGQN
jgi:hypothetical protein